MITRVRERLLPVWKRVLSLSWPIMAEHVLRTGMRTTDVIVTGLFSPAAVAAVGLADLYARLPLRIGLGLGSGAIALSSQDTGSGATTNRDVAITQSIALGILAGIPFILFGVVFGRPAIAILGAPPEVARMGGTYLAIIFATGPARHTALIGARALQGTGDTRTPMYINVVSNSLNILGTVGLGLGLGPLPRLGIVGVGVATAVGNVFTAITLLGAIASPWTAASFVLTIDRTIIKQLLVVSAPRIGEGLAATIAEFPFNSILLGFGTEVNAAYQIGRRMYQQVTAPLSRGYNTAASIVVGQALGEGDPAAARFNGWATAALGIVTVGTIGIGLVLGAEQFVELFTRDAATIGYAADFARAYGLAAPLTVIGLVLAGALRGGSETRVPFIARTTGMFGFMLGFTYLTGVWLGYGVLGAYAGIILFYAWNALVVGAGFYRGSWASRAERMMAERGSDEDPSVSPDE
ncbi:MAG: MATE family efflux transporter [Halobacteriales archaeon]|nr:MATE family efflux transporter [Halobacteriales archaeon]